MSKYFVTVYATATKNAKEKAMGEWIDSHFDHVILSDNAAYELAVRRIKEKADELDKEFTRSRKAFRIADNRFPGGPWFIDVNDYISIRCTIVRKQIYSTGEEVVYE